MTHTDPVQTKELSMRATALCGWALASDRGLSDAVQNFRARGHSRYLKAHVDPVLSTDQAVALMPLQTAFLALVDAESLLGRLDGVVRIPIDATARLQVGTVIATEVPEGGVKPVATIAFDVAGPVTKVEAQIVASAEAVRSFDAGTQDGIRQVLVSACAPATDRVLVDALTASAPIGSATPAALLAAISGGQPRKPYVIGGLDTVLALPTGTVQDLASLGIPVLTSPAAAGLLIAVDAAGLLISDDGILVDLARHANLLMDSGGSPAGTTVVNLWTANLTAIRAERTLRLTVRDGAAAWGTP